MATRIKWYGPKLLREMEKPKSQANKRLIAAGLAMSAHIQRSMGHSGIMGTKRGATKAERRAHPSAPGEYPHVDTGRLKASITVNWYGSPYGRARPRASKTGKQSDGASRPDKPLTVRVGTNVEYAIRLELGTKRMGPRPFMRMGFDESRATMKRIIATGRT